MVVSNKEVGKDQSKNGTAEKIYKDTLNLPNTDFPMRASLPTRETEQVSKWLSDSIYQKILEKNKRASKGPFLLHDGPPYANGNIHMGHALNKILKDVVVKYKGLQGFETQYIPGWDCHGLPIELGVEKKLREEKKDKASLQTVELRALCRAYAQKFVDTQKAQFQRLEIFADWDHPYLTMDNSYVASIVRELGRCADSGVLYRGNKPVYWCCSCKTALAEAEIEYANKKSPSVMVKFDLTSESLDQFSDLKKVSEKVGAERTSLLIWTTTPWTLPANYGIALSPDLEYVAIKVPLLEGTEIWIVAKDLQESVEKTVGMAEKSEPLLTFRADSLHKLKAKHPFLDRESLVILGHHVTAESGTGVVHTAPGHGHDDFIVGKSYGLPTTAPVDDRGCYTNDFPAMKDSFVFKSNEPIIKMLEDSGHLANRTDIEHSYPHCWRCHSPVIFRATPQWFISMDTEDGATTKEKGSLRKQALAAIDSVTWIPSWGINRIQSMVENRPDWCVSRQRTWGVPITVFYCQDCDHPLLDQQAFTHVANLIDKKGVDVWFTSETADLLPPGAKCKSCQSTLFRKEKDILDVWFDSGVSHAAVCEARDLGWPADLYLEGSDQHRGWFQTSLLTAVATRSRAPFKNVLTHGFVNDKDGRKMSKSKGNIVAPLDLVKTHGAENLRLWAVLEDYRNDLSFSKESLERVSETYRKIRNTIRFILGNLADFEPDQHFVPLDRLRPLDRWAMAKSAEVFEKMECAYDRYEFHLVYHLMSNFCGVDLSALYFDILKDRLYTAGKESLERRSAQTAMYQIGSALVRSLAPILSFTSEEAWKYLPKFKDKQESVFLSRYPDLEGEVSQWKSAEILDRFDSLWTARSIALKALEEARSEKQIGHPREAKVTLHVPEATRQHLEALGEDLSRLLLVSEFEFGSDASDIRAVVAKASGQKCPRCWVYAKTQGKSKEHPELCERCVQALEV